VTNCHEEGMLENTAAPWPEPWGIGGLIGRVIGGAINECYSACDIVDTLNGYELGG